ncbi:MAG: response regulator, partial [Anaerolineae bacterium]
MGSNSRILVVDDVAAVQQMIEALLRNDRHGIEFASSGEEALRKLASMDFDLVLLDVAMPGMDGFEVCRRLRADPRLAEIPIVIITALADKVSLLRGLEAGADDFITKPFDPIELRARVRAITRLNRYRMLLAERSLSTRLAVRMENIQESERRRLARELHDRVGQNLTALSINLNIVDRQVRATAPAAVMQRLSDSLDLVTATAQQIRDVTAELRPPALDDCGLAAALHWYGEQFSRRTGVSVQVLESGPKGRLPLPVETALFRIAQEALTNVAKHAQASAVQVDLNASGNAVTMIIGDDGQGFKTSGAPASAAQPHWGLLTMKERARAVDAAVEIESTPGQGTWVKVAWRKPNDD